MNKIAIAVIVVGVLLVIGGAVLWKSSGDELEGLADNNRLYEGADSAMELEGWDKNDNYLVVVMEGRYANGRSSIPEGESANLTTEDCNLVGDFTLTQGDVLKIVVGQQGIELARADRGAGGGLSMPPGGRPRPVSQLGRVGLPGQGPGTDRVSVDYPPDATAGQPHPSQHQAPSPPLSKRPGHAPQ